LNIIDGTVTWQLLAPVAFAGVLLGAGAGENRFIQCDVSGIGYSQSVSVQSTGAPAVTVFADSVFSAPVVISLGVLAILRNCELGADVTISGGYAGNTIIEGCSSLGNALNVTIGANVSNFVIADNFFDGGTITVTAGTSNHYRIANNPNCTISDGGTGADKVVLHSTALTIGNKFRMLSSGKIGIGFESNPQYAVVASLNSTIGAGATTSGAVPIFYGIGPDGVQCDVVVDSYGVAGGAGSFVSRVARGDRRRTDSNPKWRSARVFPGDGLGGILQHRASGWLPRHSD
jgi:hypothetical protein